MQLVLFFFAFSLSSCLSISLSLSPSFFLPLLMYIWLWIGCNFHFSKPCIHFHSWISWFVQEFGKHLPILANPNPDGQYLYLVPIITYYTHSSIAPWRYSKINNLDRYFRPYRFSHAGILQWNRMSLLLFQINFLHIKITF